MTLRFCVKAGLLCMLAFYPLAEASEQCMTEEATGIQNVPKEPLNQIVEYLPPRALCNLACVNKKFHALSTTIMDKELESLKLDLRIPKFMSRPQCYQTLTHPDIIDKLMQNIERGQKELKVLYQPTTVQSFEQCLSSLKAMGYGIPQDQSDGKTQEKHKLSEEQQKLLDEFDEAFKPIKAALCRFFPISHQDTAPLLPILEKILNEPALGLWQKALAHTLFNLMPAIKISDFQGEGLVAPFLTHKNPDIRYMTYHVCLEVFYNFVDPLYVNFRANLPLLKFIAAFLRSQTLESSDPIIYAIGLAYRINGKALSAHNPKQNKDYLVYLEPVDEGFLPKYVALLGKWQMQAKLPQHKTE